MADYTRLQLRNIAIRRAKIPTNNQVVLDAIDDDLDQACQIIAGKRFWPQLVKTNTLSLTASDGDISYALQSDVDEVEQFRITSPTSYSAVLQPVDKLFIRQVIPNKTLPGRTVPSKWYFVEPTISSTNVETKNITFDYLPDQAYTVTYSYKSFAPALSGDGSYPFFDSVYHMHLVNYAIWKYAERTPDASLNPVYWRGEWEFGVQTIEDDEQGQSKFLLPIPGPNEG